MLIFKEWLGAWWHYNLTAYDRVAFWLATYMFTHTLVPDSLQLRWAWFIVLVDLAETVEKVDDYWSKIAIFAILVWLKIGMLGLCITDYLSFLRAGNLGSSSLILLFPVPWAWLIVLVYLSEPAEKVDDYWSKIAIFAVLVWLKMSMLGLWINDYLSSLRAGNFGFSQCTQVKKFRAMFGVDGINKHVPRREIILNSIKTSQIWQTTESTVKRGSG